MPADPENIWRAGEILLGQVVREAIASAPEVDYIAGENGNGTWFEVAMENGTLIQITVEASRG